MPRTLFATLLAELRRVSLADGPETRGIDEPASGRWDEVAARAAGWRTPV